MFVCIRTFYKRSHVCERVRKELKVGGFHAMTRLKGLTRHKISDRWRRCAWLRFECGSHRTLERGAASGSLDRLVRSLTPQNIKTSRVPESRRCAAMCLPITDELKVIVR